MTATVEQRNQTFGGIRDVMDTLGVGEDAAWRMLRNGMIVGAYRLNEGAPWQVPLPVQVRETHLMMPGEAATELKVTSAGLAYLRKKGNVQAIERPYGQSRIYLYTRSSVEEEKQRRRAAGILDARRNRRRVTPDEREALDATKTVATEEE